jgi:hypothetical protein
MMHIVLEGTFFDIISIGFHENSTFVGMDHDAIKVIILT